MDDIHISHHVVTYTLITVRTRRCWVASECGKVQHSFIWAGIVSGKMHSASISNSRRGSDSVPDVTHIRDQWP